MEHIVIAAEKNRYLSFPHIAVLPSGKLLVVFRKASEFSAEAAKKGVATHHDPDSSIELTESIDGGLTWSSPKTVYKSKWGVNDPALTILSETDWLVRFVALDIRPRKLASSLPMPLFSHRTEHGLVTSVVGNLVLRTRDAGKSWTEVGLAETSSLTRSCSRDPIVVMADGSWLMPVYTGAPQRTDLSWVIRSFDEGKTWCEPTQIMGDPNGAFSQLHGVNYNETSLLPLSSGEILALVRADRSFHTDGEEFMPVGGIGELYLSRSFDSGLCWQLPKRTGIWGQPGSLISLANGDLLATYGYRKQPFGVRACLSKDRGETWRTTQEIILREDCSTWDCGYPFSAQLSNGKIFSVYYFVDKEGFRFIAGTHWSLS